MKKKEGWNGPHAELSNPLLQRRRAKRNQPGSTWHELSRWEQQIQLGLALPQELLGGQAPLQAAVLDQDPRRVQRYFAHHLFLAGPSARAVSLQLQLGILLSTRHNSPLPACPT